MVKSHVKTYKHRIGKNSYVIIQIFQSATAQTTQGNALASNAVNVKMFKSTRPRRR